MARRRFHAWVIAGYGASAAVLGIVGYRIAAIFLMGVTIGALHLWLDSR